jgi:hypothetical protein
VLALGPPLVVFIVVDVVVNGHSGHEAQNHWSQAASQPPPKVEHKSSWHWTVVVLVVLVLLVVVNVVVMGH